MAAMRDRQGTTRRTSTDWVIGKLWSTLGFHCNLLPILFVAQATYVCRIGCCHVAVCFTEGSHIEVCIFLQCIPRHLHKLNLLYLNGLYILHRRSIVFCSTQRHQAWSHTGQDICSNHRCGCDHRRLRKSHFFQMTCCHTNTQGQLGCCLGFGKKRLHFGRKQSNCLSLYM